MMARVETSHVLGIDAVKVLVEVDVGAGMPSFQIVGLPDTACRESGVRVRSAIKNSGFKIPYNRRILINLAPADIKKEGSSFDLPIAIGILIASGQIIAKGLDSAAFCGELSLDGYIRSVTGILSRAHYYSDKNKRLIFPVDNYAEAAAVQNINLIPVETLKDAINLLRYPDQKIELPGINPKPRMSRPSSDFKEVKGQWMAKRGIEVACSGGHNLIMIGPPGAGKTMLAKRMPTILPEMSLNQSIETTKIHSIAGILRNKGSLIIESPFRAPHHTISDAALVGGGSFPRPGEISLAHHGILFLDEIPEFRRNVLEVLRQPLEEGRIVIARSQMTLAFPANFLLVAAMNPCPCGYLTDEKRDCFCSPIQIKNYQSKVSGPLMDRIDIHLEVQALKADDFVGITNAEGSDAIRQRVLQARKIQLERYKGKGIRFNAGLEGQEAESLCQLNSQADDYLKDLLKNDTFSGRAYHKILKISRTIADLDDSKIIRLKHIQEAVMYRTLDKKSLMGQTVDIK